jgi:hypothetical protein
MKRIGDLKSQIDRWPLSDLPKSPYMVSIVTLCMFTGKPSEEDIARVLDDAACVVRDGVKTQKA